MQYADGERAFELLQKMGFTRVTGTEEERRAADLLQKEVEALGVQCRQESFAVKGSRVLKAALTVLEPYEKEYEVTGYEGAACTPAGGLTAEFAYIGEADETSLISAKGKIVLMNGRVTMENYPLLAEAAVAGFVTMSGALLDKREESDLETRKLRPAMGNFTLLPGLNLRIKDALEMVQLGAKKVKIELRTESADWTSQNVVATLPGARYPEEVLVLGAHYDSVPFSSGVYDNGAGCVSILEALRYFIKNPPLRTLRFVWFGSEEQGILGSQAYLEQHEEELKKHLFMLNSDVGAIALGHNFAGVSAEKEVQTYLEYVAKEAGISVKTMQDAVPSDSTPFAYKGVPAVGFGRGAVPGAEYMHTRYDCMEFQSAKALQGSCDLLIAFAKRLCEAEVFPLPRTVPASIAEKAKKLVEQFRYPEK